MKDKKKRIVNLLCRYLPSILFLTVAVILLILYGAAAAVIFAAAIIVAELIAYVCFCKGSLKIKTPDGYDEPYHPSVLCFENRWNGWKYWMAFTPMPHSAEPYPDRWENPCVVVSDDGLSWEYPNGKVTALEDLSDIQIKNKNYHSDTHLVFNEDKNRLELFFRLNEGENCEQIHIFRKCSYDGVTWPEKELLTSENNEVISLKAVSPAVIYENGSYLTWFVADEGAKGPVYIASSEDGLFWSDIKKCELKGRFVEPWHIDCRHIDGCYKLLVYDQNNELTLWESADGICFDFAGFLLKPSRQAGSFYNNHLYRACLVNTDAGCRMYFTAGNGKKNGLGVAQLDSGSKVKVISASQKNSEDYAEFFGDLFEKYTLIIFRIFQIIRNK